MTASSVTAPRIFSIGLTAEQVEARKKGIGGSDAAAVLGCNPYRTALDIYLMKVGEREPDPPNAAMKRGIYLEPLARKLYRELTGRRIKRLPQVEHASYPWMMCNVDGMIVANKKRNNGHDGAGVLELKCPGIWTFAKIKREGLPLHWIAQMVHNLEVTGFKWGSFALFNADLWELLHFDVVRDEDLARAIILAEQKFWLQHVEPRIPPPVEQNTTPELMAALAKAEEQVGTASLIVRNDPEFGEAARMYLEAKELLETAENLKESAVEKLKGVMVEKGAVEGAGIRCYWSDRAGKRTFQREALENAKPLDSLSVAAHINSFAMLTNLQEALLAGLEKCRVDFTQYFKTGKPYEDFRIYQLKSVGVGD